MRDNKLDSPSPAITFDKGVSSCPRLFSFSRYVLYHLFVCLAGVIRRQHVAQAREKPSVRLQSCSATASVSLFRKRQLSVVSWGERRVVT